MLASVAVKAWRISAHGGPEALELAEVPAPQPARGEKLIRVAAAALNFSDLLMLRGTYQVKPALPFIPGQEIAGTVESSGERIASKVVWGGFAEYALVREDMAVRLPPEVDFLSGATLPVVWPTAWIALFDRAELKSGETLLVLAAAGGTGLAALQLAKAAGARVIAAVGSTDKFEICRAQGADEVVDYSSPRWTDQVLKGAPVDVIFDPVGGELTEAGLKCLARRGRLLIVGFSSGSIPALRAHRLLLKSASALGVYWSHEHDAALVARAFEDLWRRHAAGQLDFGTVRAYPFAGLREALADLGSRRTTGKCVLRVAE